MATPAQVEANRRNSQMSTGPTSPDGKVASGRNSRTHGLSGPSILPETTHPEFAGRLERWAAEHPVATGEQRLALETAVAMTFRIAECAAGYRGAIDDHMDRARHAWDADRADEAAALFARLPRRPGLVASTLRTTARGTEAMLGAWLRLAGSLDAKGAWSDAEVSTACDLLGIHVHLRDGRLAFDPLDPADDPREARRAFALREADRLREALNQRMEPLESLERDRAEAGHSAFFSKRVQLTLRYEREAYRRYEAAMRVVKSGETERRAVEARPPIEPPPVVRFGEPSPPAEADPEELDGPTDAESTATFRGLAGTSPELARAMKQMLREEEGIAPPVDVAVIPEPVATPGPRREPTRPMNRRRRRRDKALARQHA